MDYPCEKFSYILQYVKAKLEDKQDDLIYRVYVTDALKAISSQNTMMTSRFYDMIAEPPKKKSSDEIKKEIFAVFDKLNGGENNG